MNNGENQACAGLLAMLDGSTFANAMRDSGKPCRIQLPDDTEARLALVHAHLLGAPATLTFHAEEHPPWTEHVDAVVLAAFCPAADGRCHWLGIDLDATDHGERGLVDPVHATRVISERAANAGLDTGLLVARSRRGKGRHVFLLLPEPVGLSDAVIGVAALVAGAFAVAARDAAECGTNQAFRRISSTVARPGDAGAVELLPRSTVKPSFGWALALPTAGAYAAQGGGVVVDPFTGQPTVHDHVPRCDSEAWARFIAEARCHFTKVRPRRDRFTIKRDTNQRPVPLDRVDSRTRDFVSGRVPEGLRNSSAFAASANLLGCGIDAGEAERLILAGAVACGLPEREAKLAFQSAVKAHTRRGR